MREIFAMGCLLTSCTVSAPKITPLSGFPDDVEGLAKGVSACYAGSLDGRLVMAGGCNFPGLPPRLGGVKKYYQGIYAATFRTGTELEWERVGDLPAPAAYGVSVTTEEGMVCIGGNNLDGPLDTVVCITLEAGKAVIKPLPSLPFGLDNMTGACTGTRIFVAGGNLDGTPCRKALYLDLQDIASGWKLLPDFPGPRRTQPVSAAFCKDGDYDFYLWGGFAGAVGDEPVTLSVDGVRYSTSTGAWTPVAAPAGNDGETISLGGGAAAVLGGSKVVATGGVDKNIFYNALVKLPEGYLDHEPEWYRFNRKVLVYDRVSDSWTEAADTPETARAGAVLVGDGRTFCNICGELKPGVRSPQVTLLSF